MNRNQFLVGNWDNHKILLWPALELIKHMKLPVLELGAGHYSTPFLRKYCQDEGLEFLSYDFHEQWAKDMNVIHVKNWETDVDWTRQYGVVLVDESPGENRKFSLQKLHHAQIVVAHDTEPAADHGYQMRSELAKFKFQIDYKTEGAWASAVSDLHDVTKLNIEA